MDNKLRKLAREIVEELVDCGCADPEPVQQYLTWTETKLRSALLAELEAKEAKIVELRDRGINAVTAEERTSTEWQKRAETAEQRIAELERITEGVDQLAIDGGWTARGMSEYAKSLESKLATPVRLSDTTHPRCRRQHADDIRAAGFTVEGDA
ncbi:hypothetical protein [Serratia quinivorans]